MSLTITIPGAVNVTTGSFAPAVLTIGVGVPGAQGPQGPAGPGVPAGGTAGQFLTKINGTDYNTDWTTVNLAAYAVKANNLSDLTSASTARTNLGLGTMATATAADYSTTVVNNGLYYPLSGNPSSFLTASALTGYATQSFVAANYAPIAAGLPTGGTVGQVLTKNSGTDYDDSWQTLIPGDRYVTSSTTSNTIGNGAKTFTVGTGLSYSSQQDVVISYDASNHMHAVVTSYDSGTGVLVVDVRSHTGSGTYTSWTVNVGGTTPLQTVEWGEILGVLGDQTDLATALNAKLETSTAASTYAALAGATFTGEVVTPASTTSNAGLTITPGVAPTTPTNGEIWTTTTDLQVRLNGVTETVAEQSWVTANFYPLTGNPSGFLTSASLSGYALLSGATFTGLVGTVASATTGAGLNIPHGAAPTTPVNGDLWTTTGGLFWRQNGSTQQAVDVGSTQTISGNKTFSNANLSLGTSTAAGTINLGTGATISGATKTINIGTAGVSGSTTNINLGTTSGGGATITLQNNTTVGGTLTVNGASLSLGTSTAAGTIGIGTGATVSGSTRTINIGTASAAGSTNAIVIGGGSGTSTTTVNGNLTTTGTTTDIANSTAAQQINIGAGGTISGATKTITIGNGGASGSTTNVSIASSLSPPSAGGTITIGTTGQTTTTLQGTTNGVTVAADTNSTALATTAYVVGQAGSATPLVNGTAAVGTSLRYARQDHVHPTDTSRAALASPTFTGTPAAPTAAVDTNTTQLATTAYVVGQGYAKLASPALTGTPTAPTATAGTNTTQIATTAFVQAAAPNASTTVAGKVELATTAEVIVGTSTSLVSPLSEVGAILTRPELRSLVALNGTAVSGSGGVSSGNSVIGFREMFLSTPAVGRAAYNYGIPGNNVAQPNMSRADWSRVDFSKKIWISGKSVAGTIYNGTSYLGDANTFTRVTLGGYNSQAVTGDMTLMGIGWKKQGGTSPFFTLTVHNGTTLTDVATTVTQSDGKVIDWVIYSDGTGNVTLYIDGAQAATTTAGPTGISNSGAASYREQVEAATTPGVRQLLESVGGWIYIQG